ncbi:MAG: hypothetical protein ETSY1_21005 [Candidatus Entotheonella factor]|uniref:Uncharacterized protein n=1 Tax=Entotheonella factor TaxID=1429438 RepID=W4LJ07_ENTF1|nr:MAG: hypothetical protein ETSY1_21005 [Candidatus Entotheonella factor]
MGGLTWDGLLRIELFPDMMQFMAAEILVEQLDL